MLKAVARLAYDEKNLDDAGGYELSIYLGNYNFYVFLPFTEPFTKKKYDFLAVKFLLNTPCFSIFFSHIFH